MNTVHKCPICHRTVPQGPQTERLRPFCSRRCADVDLGRWFGGDYRVPGPSIDPMQPETDPSGTDPSQNRSSRVDPGEGLG